MLLGVTGLSYCGESGPKKGDKVRLPEPRVSGNVSVEQALQQRRSCREFSTKPLDLEQVGRLLWSAQGITGDRGRRTTPSAGATYPLECYLVAGRVDSLKPGIYRYVPQEHSLVAVAAGDRRGALSVAASNQEFVARAPISIVIAADYGRTSMRYGDRGQRYVHIEVGHCAENIALECEALGLGTVCVGAFADDDVRSKLELTEDPVCIMPVGWKSE
jgi:SagB-type dehydrogenase family enzyme